MPFAFTSTTRTFLFPFCNRRASLSPAPFPVIFSVPPLTFAL